MSAEFCELLAVLVSLDPARQLVSTADDARAGDLFRAAVAYLVTVLEQPVRCPVQLGARSSHDA